MGWFFWRFSGIGTSANQRRFRTMFYSLRAAIKGLLRAIAGPLGLQGTLLTQLDSGMTKSTMKSVSDLNIRSVII